MVGSMVQFRDGKPDKSNYRRYKIKTVEGIDDFASIAEVVKRRYQRLTEEHAPFPDLVIVDGGRAQLSAARGALSSPGGYQPAGHRDCKTGRGSLCTGRRPAAPARQKKHRAPLCPGDP